MKLSTIRDAVVATFEARHPGATSKLAAFAKRVDGGYRVDVNGPAWRSFLAEHGVDPAGCKGCRDGADAATPQSTPGATPRKPCGSCGGASKLSPAQHQAKADKLAAVKAKVAQGKGQAKSKVKPRPKPAAKGAHAAASS